MSIKTQGHGEKFSRRKEAALAALLEYPSLTTAAEHCGVSQRTVRRWLRDEGFAQQYRSERSRLLENTVNVLRQKSIQAIETLASLSNDEKSPSTTRVVAASKLIELTLRAAELLDVEQRIEELEQLAARDKP